MDLTHITNLCGSILNGLLLKNEDKNRFLFPPKTWFKIKFGLLTLSDIYLIIGTFISYLVGE
jgi:hypothetical protein